MSKRKAKPASGNGKPDKPKSGHTAAALMPSVASAAVMSFLKDTRGLVTWTARDLAETLNIASAEATKVLTILAMQGYVKETENGREWLTTSAGEAVSGSKLPHFSPERVEKALNQLKERIVAVRKDFKAPFKITKAVAFGDFLSGQARVQAADVGIELERRKSEHQENMSATEARARNAFLKQLRVRNAALNVQPYQEWMSARTHRKLI
jgi:hypothetical protein